jgi:hypothetical protein
MARSPDWETLPMAAGDPAPVWPLPGVTPKFAAWSIGGGRPFNCALEKCERWHAGIDLTGAPDGATIVAPEDALVVGIDRGWSEGSKAAFLRTKTGLFIVLGGFKAGSHKEFDIQTAREVRKGEKLGRILGSYGMIHLETYAAEGRVANSVWWKSEPPPDGLQNPTNYVERMVGAKVSLVQTRQRHEALAALGYFAGDVAASWGPASEAALRAAQTALGVDPDGKWGPKTEDAIQRKLGELQGCAGDECSIQPGAGATAATTGGDPLRAASLLGKIVIGAVGLAGVATGVLIWKWKVRDV